MVQQGGFTVELVHADSRIPFKQHWKDGQVYVEAEKDAEYFIHVKNSSVEKDSPLLWGLAFRVDNKSLGYYEFSYKSLPLSGYYGVFERQGSTERRKPLKFVQPTFGSQDHSLPSLPGLMGTVEARISLARKGEWGMVEDICSGIGGSVSGTRSSNKKVFRTGIGSSTEVSEIQRDDFIPEPFAHVQTIKLNYCSTVGLINVGILPKPSNTWDYHQALFSEAHSRPPALNEGDTNFAPPPPKKIRVRKKNSPESDPLFEEVELYDLAGAESDDSDQSHCGE